VQERRPLVPVLFHKAQQCVNVQELPQWAAHLWLNGQQIHLVFYTSKQCRKGKSCARQVHTMAGQWRAQVPSSWHPARPVAPPDDGIRHEAAAVIDEPAAGLTQRVAATGRAPAGRPSRTGRLRWQAQSVISCWAEAVAAGCRCRHQSAPPSSPRPRTDGSCTGCDSRPRGLEGLHRKQFVAGATMHISPACVKLCGHWLCVCWHAPRFGTADGSVKDTYTGQGQCTLASSAKRRER